MICLFKEIIFNNLDEDSNDTESDKITLFFKQQLDSLANILRYICFSFPIAYYINFFYLFLLCVVLFFVHDMHLQLLFFPDKILLPYQCICR